MNFILVRGGDKAAPRIARESGWLYGVRHDYKPYGHIHMLDIHWHDYDWDEYMKCVHDYAPNIAMVADYEHLSEQTTMLKQISDLRGRVDIICACPKFAGATNDIPHDVRLAISIPAKSYAGYLPPLDDIRDRDVHLLGGNPQRQLNFALTAKSVNATVKSLDGNYHVRKAGLGQYFDNGSWMQIRDRHVSSEQLAIISGQNIKRWFVRNYHEITIRYLL